MNFKYILCRVKGEEQNQSGGKESVEEATFSSGDFAARFRAPATP